MSPEVLYGLGALILLCALIYGTVQWKNRNKALDPVTEAKTRQNYNSAEAERKSKGEP